MASHQMKISRSNEIGDGGWPRFSVKVQGLLCVFLVDVLRLEAMAGGKVGNVERALMRLPSPDKERREYMPFTQVIHLTNPLPSPVVPPLSYPVVAPMSPEPSAQHCLKAVPSFGRVLVALSLRDGDQPRAGIVYKYYHPVPCSQCRSHFSIMFVLIYHLVVCKL